jgi:hypothetical protein
MAKLFEPFNIADVPENQYELIAPGKYQAMIVANTLKENKAKDGAYYELEVSIQTPSGSKTLKEMLNIQNKNETAVRIAQQTLRDICIACNKTSIQDLDEVMNIRMLVNVVVEGVGKKYTDSTTGEEKESKGQNRIKKYEPYNANAATQQAQASTQATDNRPIWQKR